MSSLIKRLWGEEEGQGLAEYGLILVLIAIAVIGALGAMAGGLDDILRSIANTLGGQ